MGNFWDYSSWSGIFLIGILLGALLIGNVLKKAIPFLRESLVPTSVLAGIVILIFTSVYKAITGEVFFDTGLFNGKGTAILELITYHALALGFIASSLKTTGGKLTKQRSSEIFNTGVTTVSTYLIQAIFGFGITLVAALIIKDLLPAAGVLLPFGYGQGTGQALNYGSIYETDYGFVGGRSFGLSIAALGFLSASIGGVIHLAIMKKRNKLVLSTRTDGSTHSDRVEMRGEIPMQESIDKLTIQVAIIALAYGLTYAMMYGLGALLPGMKSTIYGFNFLLGVVSATLIKITMNFLRRKHIMKKKYTNNFLMTRVSNLFFDVMVVAGIAAIRLDILEHYWGILLILGIVGLIITYVYNRIVAKTLFPDYYEEQFLMMYGMLTGTASTGTILLREVDKEFRTPASDNMIYQNFPAIVFGFPMMFLATLAPQRPILTMIIFVLFFIVMNIILFRSKIFKRKNKTQASTDQKTE
jgi:ESS family glutamate:Na+ symporter